MKNDITPRNRKADQSPLAVSSNQKDKKLGPIAKPSDRFDGHKKLRKRSVKNNGSGLLLGATLGAFIGSLGTFTFTRYGGVEPNGLLAVVMMLLGAGIGISIDLILLKVNKFS